MAEGSCQENKTELDISHCQLTICCVHVVSPRSAIASLLDPLPRQRRVRFDSVMESHLRQMSARALYLPYKDICYCGLALVPVSPALAGIQSLLARLEADFSSQPTATKSRFQRFAPLSSRMDSPKTRQLFVDLIDEGQEFPNNDKKKQTFPNNKSW